MFKNENGDLSWHYFWLEHLSWLLKVHRSWIP